MCDSSFGISNVPPKLAGVPEVCLVKVDSQHHETGFTLHAHECKAQNCK
jgi:hypothetical protein